MVTISALRTRRRGMRRIGYLGLRCRLRVVFLHCHILAIGAMRVYEIRDQHISFFWPRVGSSAAAVTGWRAVTCCVEMQSSGKIDRTASRFVPSFFRLRHELQSLHPMRANIQASCCGRHSASRCYYVSSREGHLLPNELEPSTCYIFRSNTLLRGGQRSSSDFSLWPSLTVATCFAIHGEVCKVAATTDRHHLGSCQAGTSDMWVYSNSLTGVVNVTDHGQISNLFEEVPRRGNHGDVAGKLCGDYTFVEGVMFRRNQRNAQGFIRSLTSAHVHYVRIPLDDNLDTVGSAHRHGRYGVPGPLTCPLTLVHPC